jgi:hypothetical protein
VASFRLTFHFLHNGQTAVRCLCSACISRPPRSSTQNRLSAQFVNPRNVRVVAPGHTRTGIAAFDMPQQPTTAARTSPPLSARQDNQNCTLSANWYCRGT